VSPTRVPIEGAVNILLLALRPQQPSPHTIARLLEAAWSDGRVRVWRDDRLMAPHDMLCFCVHIVVDADGRGFVCSVEPRPGTVTPAGAFKHIYYPPEGGAVAVTARLRWEFDRADVEALPASLQDVARKGGNRRTLIWDEWILPGLAIKVTENGRPFVDFDAAVTAARTLRNSDPKKRKLSDGAVLRGMKKWCRREWIAKA
jgi:hypothetical protein